jgi:hypothetical protein
LYLLAVVLLPLCAVAFDTTWQTVRIDGVNRLRFSLYQPLQPTSPLNIRSLHGVSPRYLFDDLSFTAGRGVPSDSLVPIHFWADIGAETGEPLFARVEGGPAENREHITFAGARVHLRETGATAGAVYRHVGSYADRHFRFWSEYSAAHGGRPPVFGTGEMGISNYYAVVAEYGENTARNSVDMLAYEHWILTPFFFTPFFTRGLNLSHNAAWEYEAVTIRGIIDLEMQDRYPDHADYERIGIGHASMKWQQSIGSGRRTFAEVQFLSQGEPAGSGRVGYADTTGALAWSSSAGLHIDGSPFGRMEGGWDPSGPLQMDANAGWAHYPSTDRFTFMTAEDSVRYREESLTGLQAGASATISSLANLPVRAAAFIVFDDAAPWLVVDTVTVPWSITRTSGESDFRTGLTLLSEVQFHQLALSFAAVAQEPLGSRPPVFIPWEVNLGLRWGASESVLPFLECDVTLQAPVEQRYRLRPGNRVARLRADGDIQVSMQAEIPFVSPFYRDRFDPRFVFTASSVSITGKPAKPLHPQGSSIGSYIGIGFSGNVR